MIKPCYGAQETTLRSIFNNLLKLVLIYSKKERAGWSSRDKFGDTLKRSRNLNSHREMHPLNLTRWYWSFFPHAFGPLLIKRRNAAAVTASLFCLGWTFPMAFQGNEKRSLTMSTSSTLSLTMPSSFQGILTLKGLVLIVPLGRLVFWKRDMSQVDLLR